MTSLPLSHFPSADVLDGLVPPHDPLIAVDIGARGGLQDLVGLHGRTSVIGFEPNPAEPGVSSSGQVQPAVLRSGHTITYPVAVCGQSGPVTLNVTRRPGGTSTLEPNVEVLERFAADAWHEFVDVVDRVTVPGITLADFMEQASLSRIDFLKLDTQGNEWDILAGAGDYLERVSVIKVEVEFVELYRGQKLFPDVMSLLHARGFELVDVASTEACRRYHVSPDLEPTAYRLVWADAVFAYQPHARGQRALQQALVLASLGYRDLAAYIVQTQAADPGTAAAMTSAFLRPEPAATRLGLMRRRLERRLGLRIQRYDWKQGKRVSSAR